MENLRYKRQKQEPSKVTAQCLVELQRNHSLGVAPSKFYLYRRNHCKQLDDVAAALCTWEAERGLFLDDSARPHFAKET